MTKRPYNITPEKREKRAKLLWRAWSLGEVFKSKGDFEELNGWEGALRPAAVMEGIPASSWMVKDVRMILNSPEIDIMDPDTRWDDEYLAETARAIQDAMWKNSGIE